MLSNLLRDKIESVSGAEANFNPTYQFGAIGNTADYVNMETSKPWFCSVMGVSTAMAGQMKQDAIKVGYTIVRPKGRDYQIDYNPKVLDGYGNGAGKTTAPPSGGTMFAEILNAGNLSPTVFNISTLATTNSMNVGPIPTTATQTGTVTDSTNPFFGGIGLGQVAGKVPVGSTPGITGKPGIKDPYRDYVPFTHKTDIDDKGKQKPTKENGVSPNMTSIRTGTVHTPTSSIKAKIRKATAQLAPIAIDLANIRPIKK